MAISATAARFDGTDGNGWVLEQGARFYRVVTISAAAANVTSARLRIRETVNATVNYLEATEADYIAIANNAGNVVLTIDVPASTTAALVGLRDSYYYDLEIAEDSDTDTTVKIIYGDIPWRREPGGAL